MAVPLVLTFAEIEFLLKAQPAQAAEVRERLRLNLDAFSDVVVAAGAASLLARGLCTMNDADVVPTEPIIGVSAGLSTSHTYTEAVGWIDEQMVLMHLFSGPSIRLAISPAAYGQFRFELLDPAEPLVDPLVRFLDSCAASNGKTAVVINSSAGEEKVGIAVATDPAGTWYVSDSVDSPDHGVPSDRTGAVQRLTDLLGPRPVGADR